MNKIRSNFFLRAFMGCIFMCACDGLFGGAPCQAQSGTPHINYPRVYGERPGRPFFFTIPATGDEPITYAAENLPPGLTLDAHTGRITGASKVPGDFPVRLTAANSSGADHQTLLIKIGAQIALTPPMGWNSWNCFAGSVNQEKVEAQARAMVQSGLVKHGWCYINIDDTWQGARTGPEHALQPNEKFPDMKKLCDDIHSMGLKAGIYSTPWEQSYAGFAGGSADNPQGTFVKDTGTRHVNHNTLPWAEGQYHFMSADARQWAAWGFDYLKYDWNPITPEQTREMGDALNATGRDFVYSLSNAASFSGADNWARLANAWRTTGDIRDSWHSMTSNGCSQDQWAPFAGPGHWNDPDMLVVGYLGWGPRLHPTRLTHAEQRTHITLWCLLASPLLIGCDMTRLDDFTLDLLSNDEVLATDQDTLGSEARRISSDPENGTEVWARPLSDGTVAVGLFNRGRYEIIEPLARHKPGAAAPVWNLLDRSTGTSKSFASEKEANAALSATEQIAAVSVSLSELHLTGPQPVRDLWRHRNLPPISDHMTISISPHDASMIKIGRPNQ